MNFVQLCRENYLSYSKGIAGVHLSAYDRAHLTAHFSLPKVEEYYRELISESSLCIVAIEKCQGGTNGGEDVMGFLVSGERASNGVARFLANNRPYVLWVILRKPAFLFQKIRYWSLSKLKRTTASVARYRLLSVAVRGDLQSCGIGRQMLAFFERGLSARGITCYGLSVRRVNERAIAFYERNGFVFEKEFCGSKYYIKRLL